MNNFGIKEIAVFDVVRQFLWRITKTNVLVKFEINEPQESCVEFHESANHLVVGLGFESTNH